MALYPSRVRVRQSLRLRTVHLLFCWLYLCIGEAAGDLDSEIAPGPSHPEPTLIHAVVETSAVTPRELRVSTAQPAYYVPSTWSPCSAPCGGGFQYRTLVCMIDSIAQQNTSACANASVPAATSLCNTAPCPASYWFPSPLWSSCSSPCVNPNDGASLGFTVRDPPVCVFDGQPQNDSSQCSGDQVAPADSSDVIACNRFECPSVFASSASWWTSPWSACTSVSGSSCGPGIRSRSVECRTGNQTYVSASHCNDGSPTPNRTESCDTGVAYGCSSDTDCFISVGPNSMCEKVRQQCGCDVGWTGAGCDVITLIPSNATVDAAFCSGGVVDAAFQCCPGPIDAVTGRCCTTGEVSDAMGRCCRGALDACGVCNGTGVAVDAGTVSCYHAEYYQYLPFVDCCVCCADGVCCETPLAPSGLCCGSAGIDSCGVCGGVNECAVNVSVLLSLSANTSYGTIDAVIPLVRSICFRKSPRCPLFLYRKPRFQFACRVCLRTSPTAIYASAAGRTANGQSISTFRTVSLAPLLLVIWIRQGSRSVLMA